MKLKRGFTLVEILIALFIFTIVSVLLTSALHNVINLQSGAESNAQRLRQLQMAMLVLSQDIEQAANQPPIVGSSREMTVTRAGMTVRRVQYYWADGALMRKLVDAAPHSRLVLDGVTSVHFQYLDKQGHFHDHWPPEELSGQPSPHAIRLSLTLANWGVLTQLYVVPN